MASADFSTSTPPLLPNSSVIPEEVTADPQQDPKKALATIKQSCEQLIGILPTAPKVPVTDVEKKAFVSDKHETCRANLTYLIFVASMEAPNDYYRPIQKAIRTELLAPLQLLIKLFDKSQFPLEIDTKIQLLDKTFNNLKSQLEETDIAILAQQIKSSIESHKDITPVNGEHSDTSPTHQWTSYQKLLMNSLASDIEVSHTSQSDKISYHEAFEDDAFLCELLEAAIKKGKRGEPTLKLIAKYLQEKQFDSPMTASSHSTRNFWKESLTRKNEFQPRYVETLHKLVLACNDPQNSLLHKLVKDNCLVSINFLKNIEQGWLDAETSTRHYDISDTDSSEDEAKQNTKRVKAKKVDTSKVDLGWLSVTKHLSDSGVISWDVKDEQGFTPLYIALAQENFQIAEVLTPCMPFCETLSIDAESQRNTLHTLVEYQQIKLIKLIGHQAEKSAQEERLTLMVNQRDKAGETPLHFAYAVCRQDIIEVLENMGANSSIKNTAGQTPSQRAPQPYWRT
ncbi:ankyrin repeat domain-containing protein [Parashewanella curva]|uniref:Ankyrin repeat domain-containing protein n=1 Tax=Parashewanella curva TaxID=2338552 RepID=A0A3L8PWS1_9GAMM|nr:ankyrin repeat domain-containing protein [Parashewanella curva]RLV59239.1 ankyrin repeat domain-containing protein [Parashewanella curva]